MARVIDLDNENLIEFDSVIGLGNFDGFHNGHKDIVNTTIEVANKMGIKSAILLFKQHTNEVFPHFPRFYISSLEDKIEILESMGVDLIYTINFTYEFAQLNRDEFILDFLKTRLRAKALVCGRDYTFGKPLDANVSHILDYKNRGLIDAYIVEDIVFGDNKISSTSIRDLLSQGKIKEASKLLGHNYTVKGKVIHGFKIGSKELGYPTANVEFLFRYLIPKEGVYLTKAKYNGEEYLSLTSIGTNPTVTDSDEVKFEVYILDFNKKIYGEDIEIEFIDFIRDQIKFDNKEDLIRQMDKDLQYALDYKKANK